MPYEQKTVPVSSLVLDKDNPRFFELKELKGRTKLSDQDLMEELSQDPDIITLMKSIKRSGVKDPIWVKKQEDGKNLVIEGNRRTYILRQLLEEKAAPPDGVHYDVVDAQVFPVDTSETELLLQRVRLQAGKKDWGAFNEALATYELRNTLKLEELDISTELQISIKEVRDRIDNVKQFKAYVKKTGDANPRRYSFFADAPKRVRDWFNEDSKNLSTYFELVAPNKQGFQRIRSVATKGGLRDFATVLDNPDALKGFLDDDEMTVEDALQITKENDITKEMPWVKRVGVLATQFNAMSEEQIERLKEEDKIVRSIKRLSRACESVLQKIGSPSEG